MTAIAVKPGRVVTPSGNGATAPQPVAAALPAGMICLDKALAALHAHKHAWGAADIDQRIALLTEIRQRMAAIGERWVGAILEAKGTAGDAFGTAEEWANYALALRWMRLLQRSLHDIQRYGRPRLPAAPKTRPDGQVTVRVFPQTLFDRMLFMGVSGEVRMRQGVTRDDVTACQALAYQHKNHPGQVALVLGAGNAAFMPLNDALHQLFIADRVVLLKLNPVNAYLAPLLEEVLHPLVQRGFLRITAGSAAEGAYLANHPAVDAIHLTGCDKTFEAIVFGPGAEGQRRKAERRPLLDKLITAELGNVTPVVAAAFERAIANLRYGTVSVNHWLGYALYLGLSPWGAYPGSDLYDVQSGIGMASNALMLDGAEKTVYRAPFHKLIDPYTVRSKRIAEFGRKFAAYDGTTSMASFASLLWTSLRC